MGGSKIQVETLHSVKHVNISYIISSIPEIQVEHFQVETQRGYIQQRDLYRHCKSLLEAEHLGEHYRMVIEYVGYNLDIYVNTSP